jgi:diguanylate cyclase (GGDEF)-like protein
MASTTQSAASLLQPAAHAALHGQPLAAKAGATSTSANGRDLLTGLANQTAFVEAVQALLDHGERQPGSHLLLIGPCEREALRRRWGAAGWDALLCQLAVELQAALRGADLPARLQGDVFAVVLPGVTPRQAQALAFRLINQLAGCSAVLGGQVLGCSLHAGLAGLDPLPATAEAWIARAGEALARAATLGPHSVQTWAAQQGQPG